MMVPKAKLEISRSSTIVIKEVFANSPWIRSYRIAKSRCQMDSKAPESVPRTRVVADRPQATATTWRPYTGVGLAGQARAGT